MVNGLDDRLRLPILLRYRYGFACGEIAEILNEMRLTTKRRGAYAPAW